MTQLYMKVTICINITYNHCNCKRIPHLNSGIWITKECLVQQYTEPQFHDTCSHHIIIFHTYYTTVVHNQKPAYSCLQFMPMIYKSIYW